MQTTKPPLIFLLFLAVVCQLTHAQSRPEEQAASGDLSVEQRAKNGDPEAQDEMGLAAEEDRQYARRSNGSTSQLSRASVSCR